MQMQGQLLAIPPSLPPSGQSSPPPPSEEEKTHRVDFPLGRAKDSQSFSPPHFLSLYYSFCRRRTTKGPFFCPDLEGRLPLHFLPLLACISNLSARGGRGCNQESSSSSKDVTHRLPWVGHQRGGDTKGKRRPPSPPTMTEKKGALPSPLYFILLSPS